jgi:hypothetical protein
VILLLTLTDTEHGRPAGWAYTLGRRFAIFHCRRFGTFHFFFRTTFNAIRFHLFPLIFRLVVFYIKRGEYLNSPEVPLTASVRSLNK